MEQDLRHLIDLMEAIKNQLNTVIVLQKFGLLGPDRVLRFNYEDQQFKFAIDDPLDYIQKWMLLYGTFYERSLLNAVRDSRSRGRLD